MPRLCESCRHPEAKEIDRKIRAGTTFEDISRWLLQEHDTKLSAPSIGQHAKNHLGHVNPKGRRPVSGDFLEAVVERTHEALSSGDLQPSIKEGIAAQKALDARKARDADRDMVFRITLALTGAGPAPLQLPPPDEEALVMEGQFRELLSPGAE